MTFPINLYQASGRGEKWVKSPSLTTMKTKKKRSKMEKNAAPKITKLEKQYWAHKVSTHRHYHHLQDCHTRLQWPVSSVSQPLYAENEFAAQRQPKSTSRTPQHITPRAALWAERVFSPNGLSTKRAAPPITATTISTLQYRFPGGEPKKNS